ncbi:putative DUF2004 family protein [Corynebacterium mustelae]|uniref:Putative DUF2004 family protein n=1 Tax=Corynebacterium mustelae TaxID=571915 RepID=A0A0G3H0J0_9CORY|nr:DUF2004 domain-containing protein [Corynebacterium mustelae]AKK06934.1 putative DUF2004 family protein [Corynebacterium mustelae]
MTVVTLPLFGAVVAGNEYDTSVDFGGRPVEASLMLSEVAELEAGSELDVFCTQFFGNWREIIETAQQAVAESPTTAEYLKHHVDELDTDALTAILGPDTPVTEAALAEKLHPVTIWSCPIEDEDEEVYGSVDFSIDAEYSQIKLAVNFDKTANVIGVEIEN